MGEKRGANAEPQVFEQIPTGARSGTPSPGSRGAEGSTGGLSAPRTLLSSLRERWTAGDPLRQPLAPEAMGSGWRDVRPQGVWVSGGGVDGQMGDRQASGQTLLQAQP